MAVVSRYVVLIFLLAAVLSGCGSSTPGLQKLPSEEADYLKAKKIYDDGDYVRAVEELGAYVEAHPGSNRLDQALLLLGLSHQRTGSNLLAVDDFNRLIRDFPQSPVREEAEFERANSHFLESLGPALDSSDTESALDLMNAYLIRYPEGTYKGQAEDIVNRCLEKLAQKAYLNAQTYLRLRHYRAAKIYLQKALDTKPDFQRAGLALAELARACTRLLEDEEARGAWQRLLDYATPERIQKDKRLAVLRREAEEELRKLGPAAEGGTTP